MSKAANTYWDEPPRPARRRNARTASRSVTKPQQRTTPWWLSCAIVTSIFVMLLVSINFRAFSEMRQELDQNNQLSGKIQNLMDENLALQEEIHSLKTDPQVIQREARRIGIALRTEKVSVPTN